MITPKISSYEELYKLLEEKNVFVVLPKIMENISDDLLCECFTDTETDTVSYLVELRIALTAASRAGTRKLRVGWMQTYGCAPSICLYHVNNISAAMYAITNDEAIAYYGNGVLNVDTAKERLH